MAVRVKADSPAISACSRELMEMPLGNVVTVYTVANVFLTEEC